MGAHDLEFYIGGQWVAPLSSARLGVENPANEEIITEIALGNAADAERAIRAARAAFPAYSAWPVAERIALLERVIAEYNKRYDAFAEAMRLEMGAPRAFAHEAQAWAGQVHLESTLRAAKAMVWERTQGTSRIVHEGIGVVGLITPWNWPMNQIACKVAPALVAGCTMVLKPSEIAPLSGLLFAEVMHAAGVPPGVFNLVNGTGAEVGSVLSRHPEVDMVSFTGSTRAGIAVAEAAAPTVKRVAQELGGKSPNILLDYPGFAEAVENGVVGCFANSGQSCDAPTRMFVPRARHEEACALALAAAAKVKMGDPLDPSTTHGPVVSRVHFDKIQGLIAKGIAEGSRLLTGGPGRPEGLNRGYFIRPTIFADMRNDMTIAREEIFGPVLAILPYDSLDHAVEMANDTPYGLGAYIAGPLPEARALARRLRAGTVNLNYPAWDVDAPFGGYKQSGNGREYAAWGIHDFCEVKAIVGWGEA